MSSTPPPIDDALDYLPRVKRDMGHALGYVVEALKARGKHELAAAFTTLACAHFDGASALEGRAMGVRFSKTPYGKWLATERRGPKPPKQRRLMEKAVKKRRRKAAMSGMSPEEQADYLAAVKAGKIDEAA